MIRTTSAMWLSIAILPILVIASHALHMPDVHACGNSMKRVIKHKPTTMMATEYLEEHAYVQAAATAFDAHSELRGGHQVSYTLTTDNERIRAAQIAAIAIVRLHGEDHEGMIEKASQIETKEDRLLWAYQVLTVRHKGDPKNIQKAVYLAEAHALSGDPDLLKQAFITLSKAADLDLMPDAHAWATLAALQRLIGADDADAVKSCETIGNFDACASLSLSLSETPAHASRMITDKRREVIKSRGMIKISESKRKAKSISLTL